MTVYRARAYGLAIQSELPLPELAPGGGEEDVVIRRARLSPPTMKPTSIQRQGIEALFGGSAREAYIRWPGVATILAVDGTTLLVDTDSDDLHPRVLNLFLLSEPLGLLSYQRGRVLLHASAVRVADRAIVFAGSPGAGKSTTAAAFERAGQPCLADDMVVIDVADGRPRLFPGYMQLKIWPPAARHLGFEKRFLRRLFPGSRKLALRRSDALTSEPVPLDRIFFLEQGKSSHDLPMTKAEALLELMRFFPCPSAVLGGPEQARYFDLCLNLLKAAGTSRLVNQPGFEALSRSVERLIRAAEEEALAGG